jgi:hypothetical protein
MTELEQAARAAGLSDSDLLTLTKPDFSPQEAVADLRRRFPMAFTPSASTGPEWSRPISRPVPSKPIAEMSPQEVDEFQRRNGCAVRSRAAGAGNLGL